MPNRPKFRLIYRWTSPTIAQCVSPMFDLAISVVMHVNLDENGSLKHKARHNALRLTYLWTRLVYSLCRGYFCLVIAALQLESRAPLLPHCPLCEPLHKKRDQDLPSPQPRLPRDSGVTRHGNFMGRRLRTQPSSQRQPCCRPRIQGRSGNTRRLRRIPHNSC